MTDFCRITGKSRGLPKPQYFPLVPPMSLADINKLKNCRITCKSEGQPKHAFLPFILPKRKNKKKQAEEDDQMRRHHYEPNTGPEKHDALMCKITQKCNCMGGAVPEYPPLPSHGLAKADGPSRGQNPPTADENGVPSPFKHKEGCIYYQQALQETVQAPETNQTTVIHNGNNPFTPLAARQRQDSTSSLGKARATEAGLVRQSSVVKIPISRQTSNIESTKKAVVDDLVWVVGGFCDMGDGTLVPLVCQLSTLDLCVHKDSYCVHPVEEGAEDCPPASTTQQASVVNQQDRLVKDQAAVIGRESLLHNKEALGGQITGPNVESMDAPEGALTNSAMAGNMEKHEGHMETLNPGLSTLSSSLARAQQGHDDVTNADGQPETSCDEMSKTNDSSMTMGNDQTQQFACCSTANQEYAGNLFLGQVTDENGAFPGKHQQTNEMAQMELSDSIDWNTNTPNKRKTSKDADGQPRDSISTTPEYNRMGKTTDGPCHGDSGIVVSSDLSEAVHHHILGQNNHTMDNVLGKQAIDEEDTALIEANLVKNDGNMDKDRAGDIVVDAEQFHQTELMTDYVSPPDTGLILLGKHELLDLLSPQTETLGFPPSQGCATLQGDDEDDLVSSEGPPMPVPLQKSTTSKKLLDFKNQLAFNVSKESEDDDLHTAASSDELGDEEPLGTEEDCFHLPVISKNMLEQYLEGLDYTGNRFMSVYWNNDTSAASGSRDISEEPHLQQLSHDGHFDDFTSSQATEESGFGDCNKPKYDSPLLRRKHSLIHGRGTPSFSETDDQQQMIRSSGIGTPDSGLAAADPAALSTTSQSKDEKLNEECCGSSQSQLAKLVKTKEVCLPTEDEAVVLVVEETTPLPAVNVEELKAIALKGIATDSFDWDLMRQKLGHKGQMYPIVILLQCKRAVYPYGASRDVLLGKTPFTLIDDSGVHFFEARQTVVTRRMSQLIQVENRLDKRIAESQRKSLGLPPPTEPTNTPSSPEEAEVSYFTPTMRPSTSQTGSKSTETNGSKPAGAGAIRAKYPEVRAYLTRQRLRNLRMT